MNALALELNEKIKAASPIAYEMLSELGKRIYFPSKGILSQSGEAKKLATKFNATIGTALENGHAMFLPSVMEKLPGVSPNEALLYAPSYGNPKLRQAWLDKDLHDNPDMAKFGHSLPVVTSGLSHALSIVTDLFLNAGSKVLIPDMNWDNYYLNIFERVGADISYFEFFEQRGFNQKALETALAGFSAGEQVMVILNFPNNPSGYTPTEAEAEKIAAALVRTAERGVRVVALVDDAYFGLFYGENVLKQSIFTKIAHRHPNLLAIKADAATKEVYVWGLRVGFITFAVTGVASGDPLYQALEAKAAGIIRSVISNCSALSQVIALNALTKPSFYDERAAKVAIMESRANEVQQALDKNATRYQDEFTPYPFNSGYFMCLKILKHSAPKLRVYLLQKYGVGTIAITETNLRVAFSSLENGQMQELFDLIYQACKDLSAECAK